MARTLQTSGLLPPDRLAYEGFSEKEYRIEGEERTYLGSTLMQAGILVENMWGDFRSKLIHIVEA